MPEMGSYCKAYKIDTLRQYPKWQEKKEGMNDFQIVYLQENYTVTGDIFLDQEILFDHITEEWKEYCRNILKFEIPTY